MKTSLLLFSFIAALPCSAAIQLITNGDFETGDFSGWTTQSSGSGQFFIDAPGTTTPASGQPTAPNPTGGSFYAVSAQTGPGVHVLRQTFTFSAIPTSAILTFDLFANNWASQTIVNPAGLTTGSGDNQHARVDLLTGSAGALDTGAGVLQNFYIGADAGQNPNPFTSYSFDIAPFITSTGDYQIRFAEADNLFFFNLGVDNVSLEASFSVIPEPSGLLTMAALIVSGSLVRRRSKNSI